MTLLKLLQDGIVIRHEYLHDIKGRMNMPQIKRILANWDVLIMEERGNYTFYYQITQVDDNDTRWRSLLHNQVDTKLRNRRTVGALPGIYRSGYQK